MTEQPEASPGRQIAAAAPAPQVPASEPSLEIDALTDVGTEREHNEDHCGHAWVGPATAVVAVADGVSSYEAGETASQKAVRLDQVLRSTRSATSDVAVRGGGHVVAVMGHSLGETDRSVLTVDRPVCTVKA